MIDTSAITTKHRLLVRFPGFGATKTGEQTEYSPVVLVHPGCRPPCYIGPISMIGADTIPIKKAGDDYSVKLPDGHKIVVEALNNDPISIVHTCGDDTSQCYLAEDKISYVFYKAEHIIEFAE